MDFSLTLGARIQNFKRESLLYRIHREMQAMDPCKFCALFAITAMGRNRPLTVVFWLMVRAFSRRPPASVFPPSAESTTRRCSQWAASGGGCQGQESVVNEQYHAPVLWRADDPAPPPARPCSCRVAVGIVKTSAAGLFKVISQLFLAGPDLRQTGADNGYTDQALPVRSTPSPKTPPSTANPSKGFPSRAKNCARNSVRWPSSMADSWQRVGWSSSGRVKTPPTPAASSCNWGRSFVVVPRLCSGHQMTSRSGSLWQRCLRLVLCEVVADSVGAPQPHIGRAAGFAQCHGAGVGPDRTNPCSGTFRRGSWRGGNSVPPHGPAKA